MRHASRSGSLPALASLLLVALLITQAHAGSAEGTSIDIPDLGSFLIGEACIHDNLAIYPVYSQGEPRSKTEFLTLAEALKKKKIKVKETGDVNRLTIRNRSDSSVFIQAGDIVRGGRQDRMIAHDLVLLPKSEPIPVDAFCVESGRWSRRGGESAGEFGSSGNRAGSNKLTLAARDSKSQAEVWKAVSETQAALSVSVETEVRDHRSPTSMELTLDNPKLRDATAPYVESLRDCVAGSANAVGAAVAINGRLQRASLFGWSGLFVEIWPRILQAASVEAVAGRRDESAEPPTAAAVGDFMWIPSQMKGEKRKIVDGIVEQRQSFGPAIRFITRDDRLGWVHAEVLFGFE